MTDPPSSVPPVEPPELEAGTLFQDRYEIVRCLGRGGMGAVYEVIHRMTDRRRALKIMLPGVAASAEARRRFEREAKITAGIDSDHIAEVLDAGVDPKTAAPYFVMELLRGRELGELLRDRKALVPAEALLILNQAALGLDRAHRHGIVHRDLKPENVFVSITDEGAPRVKLLDFGIAKVLNGPTNAGLTQGVMGTPRYIAPEQVSGSSKIGPPADLYALALVCYTCLVGEEYFAEELERAETVMQMLAAVMMGPKEDAVARARRRCGAQLPAGFGAWFAKAAHLSAEQRFASGVEMMRALAKVFELPADAARSVHMGASTLMESLTRPASPDGAAADPENGLADAAAKQALLAMDTPTLLAAQDVAVDAGATIVASSAAVPPPPPTRRRRPRSLPLWGFGLAAGIAGIVAYVALGRSAVPTTPNAMQNAVVTPTAPEVGATASAARSASPPLVTITSASAGSASASVAAAPPESAAASTTAKRRQPGQGSAGGAKPQPSAANTFNLPTVDR